MLPCSRATTAPSSLQSPGTRKRSASASAKRALRASWAMWRGHSAGGVLPLPRSCTRQAQRTGSGDCRRAAISSTIIRCTPVSTSGWCAASCGTPHRRSTSGSTRASAPESRSTANMRLGRASIKPRDSSCHTRSATRASASPASTICRHSAAVSGATAKCGQRAAKRARRRMRTGSSAKAAETWRNTPASRSCWPPNGSTSGECASSASWAMALTVRSRRARSSSSVTDGSACTVKPR